jgi:hypothetical protein
VRPLRLLLRGCLPRVRSRRDSTVDWQVKQPVASGRLLVLLANVHPVPDRKRQDGYRGHNPRLSQAAGRPDRAGLASQAQRLLHRDVFLPTPLAWVLHAQNIYAMREFQRVQKDYLQADEAHNP